MPFFKPLMRRLGLARRPNPQPADTAGPADPLTQTPQFDPSFAKSPGYDEVYSSKGVVRAHWTKVLPHIESKTEKQMEDFKVKSQAELQEEYALNGVPRMLSAAENNQLRSGADQRARALRAFLKDHYSGEKSYEKAGVIPKSVFEQILNRHHEAGAEGNVPADRMAFLYGPDIIRAPNGQFHVIEDNLGYVGGMGQLAFNREFMFNEYKDIASVIDSPDPRKFWKDITDTYKDRSVNGGRVVNVNYAPSRMGDAAYTRIQPILKDAGIPTVTLNDNRMGANKLWSTKSGVYFKDGIRGRREKVGFVICGMESYDIDPTDRAVKDLVLAHHVDRALEDRKWMRKSCEENGQKQFLRTIDSQIRELEALFEPGQDGKVDYDAMRQWAKDFDAKYDADAPWSQTKMMNPMSYINVKGFKGIQSSFRNGKINMLNTPGYGFIGDKQAYMYVENMIKFYLNEEPILKNLPTASFQTFDSKGNAKLDKALFNKVFDKRAKSRDAYVIKQVDGRGGHGVWVGPKMKTWEEFAALAPRIKADPGSYIVQQYTPLSQVDGNIVDYRMQTFVHPDKVHVAPVPWARANDADGSGKVNLCGNGSEQVVFVQDTAGMKDTRRSDLPQLPPSHLAARLRGENTYKVKSVYDN